MTIALAMSIALEVCTALIFAWSLLPYLPAGADGRAPLPYLIALQPFLSIPAVALFIAGFWIEPSFTGFIALALMWTFMPGLRYRFQRTQRLPRGKRAQHGAPIRVMTLNCRYGRADADAIVHAVRERHIDVLALQEMTADLVTRLDQAGLPKMLPHRQLGRDLEENNGGFNGIFSVREPEQTTQSAVPAMPAADVSALTVDGVTFASAHPKSPMRGCREWSDGIRALAKLGREAGGQAVILGDLNSNINHPSFNALLRDGKLMDAGQERPQLSMPTPTFPRWTKWPRITLDHVLVTTGLEPQVPEAIEIPGSDHLALVTAITRA